MPESLKENGRPSQQWYWDDWFSEFGLRLCSLAARGLWIDMLGVMFNAEIRGTLTVNGRQINGKALAKIAGDTEQNIDKYLDELEEHDVFSRLKDGTIVSRRMYRESKRKEEISRIRAEAGKKGAEARWNGKEETAKDLKDKAKMAASFSASPSISISSSKENDFAKEFEEFWSAYREIGEKKDDIGNKQEALKAYKTLRQKEEKATIVRATNGYADYLKYKRLEENFKQRKSFASTFLRSERWKEHIDFKYKPSM